MTCLILFPGTVRAEILVLQNNGLRRLRKEDENLQGIFFSRFSVSLTETCQLESSEVETAVRLGSNASGPSL